MLKVEPIKKYKSPGYPDKRVVLENPDILKTLPERWKDKAFVGLTMSSIILFLLSGCEKEQPTAGTPMPPNYLTEEEAYNVIIDETAKYGVAFDAAGLELKDIELQLDKFSPQGNTSVTQKLNMQLDGYDKDKGIGFEFVSEDDINEFNKSVQQINGEGINPLGKNEYHDKLEKAIKQKDNKVYFDAFYNKDYASDEQLQAELREQVKSFMEWLKTQGII